MSHLILIADIGGTSSRLALVGVDGVPSDIQIHRNDSFAGFESMIEADLAARDPAAAHAVRGAVLAIAGPVDIEEVRLTNRDWAFTRPELSARFGWDRLAVLNDFEALAHGVPALGADDVVTINPGHAAPDAPCLACGPGTGFGTAALVRVPGHATVVKGEGGHVRLGAVNVQEARLLAHLSRAFGGTVSVENVLSGSGLARVHQVFSGDRLESHAVIAAAEAGDEEALESCHIFLRVFGRIAGDLALLFDARGGVFLAGGVSAGLVPLFAGSPFMEAFLEHPPFDERLAATPVSVITHPTPGLLGAGQVGAGLARDGLARNGLA